MNYHRLSLVILIFIMVAGIASSSYSDISNAAVLFLRIAPGSRAAGMGEAFVAVADDATTTHWNPAGLGTYPLAQTWLNAGIPEQYRPLIGVAAVKTGRGPNYLAYDIWVINKNGLVRYDNKDWQISEVFHTKTDETVEMKIRDYFSVTDDARLSRIIDRVAAANNRGTYDELVVLRDDVISLVSEDYDDFAALQAGFDTLLASYELCLLKWDQVARVKDYVRDGLADSVFTTDEIDRINFALEKSVGRFIPEDLTIAYSDILTGEPTAIASDGEILLVGTTDGLLQYNGVKWSRQDTESGLPSNNITFLYNVGSSTVIGTDRGVALHNGLVVAAVDTTSVLTEGSVEALGGTSAQDIYAVVGGDLYHYDGMRWSNTLLYTVTEEDTPESIAAKFSVYGTTAETEKYLAKYAAIEQTPHVGDVLPDENLAMMRNTTEYAGIDVEMPSDDTLLENTLPASEDNPIRVPFLPGAAPQLEAADLFASGKTIEIPFLAELKSEVRSIHVDESGRIWLGTDQGVFYMDENGWHLPGYEKHVVQQGETLESLVWASPFGAFREAEEYVELLRDINDLDGDLLTVGDELLVYANPASAPTTRIGEKEGSIYMATSEGLLEHSTGEWSRAEIGDLGNQPMVDINTVEREIWFVSADRIVTQGKGRTELSLMHVKWLPELADDLYYEFASFVKSSESWGTFGGNVTFISYGTIVRRGEANQDLGTFESFEIAFTGSYGTTLTNNLSGGVSGKVIYSKLSDQGAGQEKGKGTATGFAIDLGLLYKISPRLNYGMAITNIGPKMSYIDAAQADDLPRNMAVGFSYKLLQSEYNRLLLTAEVNKMLVGLDDGLSEELKQLVINGGAEFVYANLFAVRAGYIFDQEGRIKTMTLGAGVSLLNRFKFDFAYIPSNDAVSLANTLRISISILP